MAKPKDNHSLKKHIAISGCEDMQAIMCPLLLKHGMTVFNYYRNYFDGSIVRLSTDRAWTEHYFKQDYLSKTTVPASYLIKPVNYYLWLTDDCPEILLDAAMNFNTSNGISIAKRHTDYIEFFCFATTVHNKAIINNFYLNNFDTLLAYSDYFTDKATALLNIAENNRLNTTNQMNLIHEYHGVLIKNQENVAKLSPRELECASFLLQGMSHKLIGKNLKLSPRTIESYLNNMKIKLNCKNQTELIIKLFTASN